MILLVIFGMIKNRNTEGIKSVFKSFFSEKKICVNQFNLSNLCSKKAKPRIAV